jgi:hypothetical protein
MSTKSVLTLAILAAGLCGLGVACKGGQGDSCSSNSDCNTSLICQPVPGRSSDYCCPAPATESSDENCHPVTTPTPTPTATSTSPPQNDAAPPSTDSAAPQPEASTPEASTPEASTDAAGD